CEKKYVVPNRTILDQIAPGRWVAGDNGQTFSVGIPMPEIDDYFNEYGAAIVYVSFGTIDYEAITQVFDGVSYHYVTKPGQIVITIESSDGIEPVNPPDIAMDVKIVLIDSK